MDLGICFFTGIQKINNIFRIHSFYDGHEYLSSVFIVTLSFNDPSLLEEWEYLRKDRDT